MDIEEKIIRITEDSVEKYNNTILENNAILNLIKIYNKLHTFPNILNIISEKGQQEFSKES